MIEQQDVLAPKRLRRHGNTILLGSIPVAVALTALVASGTWASAPAQAFAADGSAPTVIAAPEPMSSIQAPGELDDVDAAALVHNVEVILPPPPVVVAEPVTSSAKSSTTTTQKSSGSTSKSTTSKSTTTKTTTTSKAPTATKTVSFKSYCANPKQPYSASGGAKALLSAANKERARLGIGALSWSSSLASSATKWSKSMVAAGNLSHNPNRPGAENVAYSSVSSGLSLGGAISRAHKNWMYSNGHCLNIMNPAYSTMGAGAAQTADGTAWYTTENFR